MKGKSYFNVRILDMQIGMEPLIIDWAKEEPKMGQIIFMFIADNSIFKSIMQYFFQPE